MAQWVGCRLTLVIFAKHNRNLTLLAGVVTLLISTLPEIGWIELIGSSPAGCPQPKGLAKALMQEGLHRLKAVGAISVTVETGDMIPANRLYTSMGFTEMYKGYYWLQDFVGKSVNS